VILHPASVGRTSSPAPSRPTFRPSSRSFTSTTAVPSLVEIGGADQLLGQATFSIWRSADASARCTPVRLRRRIRKKVVRPLKSHCSPSPNIWNRLTARRIRPTKTAQCFDSTGHGWRWRRRSFFAGGGRSSTRTASPPPAYPATPAKVGYNRAASLIELMELAGFSSYSPTTQETAKFWSRTEESRF